MEKVMLEGLPEIITVKKEHYLELNSEAATLRVLIKYLKKDEFENLDDVKKFLKIEVEDADS